MIHCMLQILTQKQWIWHAMYVTSVYVWLIFTLWAMPHFYVYVLSLYCWQFFSLWAFVIFPLSMYMYHLWVVDLFSIFELCLISIHVLSMYNWPIFSLWAIRCPRMQQCLSHASFPGTVPYRCSRFRPTWQTAIPLYSWMLKGRILSHFWI